MNDLEAALAAHLNGKFFWEPTNNLDDVEESRDAIEIRKAQRVFAKGAKNITTRNKNLKEQPRPKTAKPDKIVLDGDQKKIEPIVNAISYAYDVSPVQLMSRSTSNTLAKPKRHLYWALFRYIPDMSYIEAGRLMGGKCHTTVMHGVATFKENQDHEKIVEVDRLMGRL